MAKKLKVVMGGIACVLLLRICAGGDEKTAQAASVSPAPVAESTPKAEIDSIIAKAQQDFDSGAYESARQALYDLSMKLKDQHSPRTDEVTKLTTRAACAAGMTDTGKYLGKEWSKHRQEMNEKAADYDLTGLRVRSVIAHMQIQCVRDLPDVAAKVLPAKYRAESYLKSLEADLAKVDAKDAKIESYIKSCGDKPSMSPWDGGSYAAESLVKETAHDPDSIDVQHCTEPALLKQGCWVFRCQVRGKNAFGALVLNEMTFHQDATTIRGN